MHVKLRNAFLMLIDESRKMSLAKGLLGKLFGDIYCHQPQKPFLGPQLLSLPAA
jgi:hypothetical protein